MHNHVKYIVTDMFGRRLVTVLCLALVLGTNAHSDPVSANQHWKSLRRELSSKKTTAPNAPPKRWSDYTAVKNAVLVNPTLSLAREADPALPVYELYQSDFDHGTLIMSEPGLFKIMEDIVFEPTTTDVLGAIQCDMPEAAEYCDSRGSPRDGYRLGFFAAITMQSKYVFLDLNGKTISQGRKSVINQRFYSHIETADQPFIPNQGPADFGGTIDSCETCAIYGPGTLARSSHHGIHGNTNRQLLIMDVKFEDYEVAAISLNGAVDLAIYKCVAMGHARNIPTRAPFSQAVFLLRFWDIFANTGPMFGFTPGKTAYDAVKAKADALRMVIVPMIDYIASETSDNNSGMSYSSLRNSVPGADFFLMKPHMATGTRCVDGNNYGIVVNRVGVAVGPFIDRSAFEPEKATRDVVIEDVQIYGTCGNIHEVVFLTGSGPDVAGGMSNLDDTSDPATRMSVHNAMDDLRSAFAQYSDCKGPGVSGVAEFAAMRAMGMMGTFKATCEWSDWYESTEIPYSDTDMTPVCNADAMNHKQKGVFGLFMQGVEGAIVKDVTVEGVVNHGALGSTICGPYISDSNPPSHLLGYTGCQAYGYAVIASVDVMFKGNNTIKDVSSTLCHASGILGLDNNDNKLSKKTDVSHVTSYAAYTTESCPPHAYYSQAQQKCMRCPYGGIDSHSTFKGERCFCPPRENAKKRRQVRDIQLDTDILECRPKPDRCPDK